MNYKKCENCGANLDLNEQCDCNKIDENAMIVVEQLPKITTRIKQIKLEVLKKTQDAAGLVVTAESKQAAKQMRTDLKKDFELLETQRKNVKALVLEPYNAFEKMYKEEISVLYNNADAELKTKIDSIESAEINAKIDECKTYFAEYAESLNIGFVSFESGGFKINLGTTQKAIKDMPRAFLDGIDKDIRTISSMEHKDEITVEYKKHLDLAKAIADVNERHKAIAEVVAENAVVAPIKEQEQITENAVMECLTAPKVDEPKITLAFKVTGTKSQLLAIREYMKEIGVEYE